MLLFCRIESTTTLGTRVVIRIQMSPRREPSCAGSWYDISTIFLPPNPCHWISTSLLVISALISAYRGCFSISLVTCSMVCSVSLVSGWPHITQNVAVGSLIHSHALHCLALIPGPVGRYSRRIPCRESSASSISRDVRCP